MKTILPLTEYLSDGLCGISTNVNFRLSIVSHNSSTFSIDVKPPLQVIQLDMFCHAVSKMLTLPAYFHNESIYYINDPFDKLLRNSEHLNFNLWESFNENVPSYTMRNFATNFSNIEEIPMGHLIDKLKNLKQVENPDNLPNWTYSIANFSIIIFIIILAITCCKFQTKLKNCSLNRSAKFRSKRKFNAEDTNPEVSTAFHDVRSDDHTTEGDVPSTPSLSLWETEDRQQFQEETSAVRKLYVLNILGKY
jgi:hypothetical protein